MRAAPMLSCGAEGASEDSGASSSEEVDEEEAMATKKSIDTPAPKPAPKFVRPRGYMLVAGFGLAICAGAVNTICFKTMGTFASHVTGTWTRVAMQLEDYADGDVEETSFRRSLGLVSCFIFGAFLCGFLVDKNEIHFGKAFYGIALMGNSALLVAAAIVGEPDAPSKHNGTKYYAAYLAAIACGLQNAMCTSHFGAAVRTTHVTGTATDIGSTAGRMCAICLRRRRCRRKDLTEMDCIEMDADGTKLWILLIMFLGFFVGAWGGALLAEWPMFQHSTHALFVPAGVTGSFGLVYFFFRGQLKQTFKEFKELANRDEVLEEVTGVEHEVEHVLEELAELDRTTSDPGRQQDRVKIRSVAANLRHALYNIKHIETELVHAPDQEAKTSTPRPHAT